MPSAPNKILSQITFLRDDCPFGVDSEQPSFLSSCKHRQIGGLGEECCFVLLFHIHNMISEIVPSVRCMHVIFFKAMQVCRNVGEVGLFNHALVDGYLGC